MIIKVCGLKDIENIISISQLDIDMVGYNFYPTSPRYVEKALPSLAHTIKKVGVFVNADIATIAEKVKKYQLDYVQLHGDETLEFTKMIRTISPIIKVFRIDDTFDFKSIHDYPFCDYFLFDTATKNFGGSGKKFDWSVLKKLNISTPFLLSGGIGPNDVDALSVFTHPSFKGIDINSKFECSPGIKDIQVISKFVEKIRQSTH